MKVLKRFRQKKKKLLNQQSSNLIPCSSKIPPSQGTVSEKEKMRKKFRYAQQKIESERTSLVEILEERVTQLDERQETIKQLEK